MRLCRYGEAKLGIISGSDMRDVTQALDVLPNCRYPLPIGDPLISNLDKFRKRANEIAKDMTAVGMKGLEFRSPVANPSKVIGAPVNYQKHMDEVAGDEELHHNNQVVAITRAGLFLKAVSSLVGPGEGIALRKLGRRNDHEVELAVVIGQTANNVKAADALDYVAGYSIGLDITIRGTEERCLRKSVDSYTVLGPWLVTSDEITDPNDLNLQIEVNGETRQDSNTKNMILSVEKLIEFASSFYTLHPGDVILTGTPEGVGPIVPGDTLTATIAKIGSMKVKVRAA
jgi:2-keto-4-pentenoate hydratase/2-oxohepta-3-ene-1,7-dioic acid hydratase in catechol pathway